MAIEMELEVERHDFLDALRKLRLGLKRNRGEELAVSYEDGMAEFAIPGVGVKVPAKGRWTGTVRCRAAQLQVHIKVPPAEEVVRLSWHEEKLYVGRWSTPAHRQDIGPPRVDLPLNRSVIDILAAGHQHNPVVLAGSGLDREYELAQKEVEKRLAQAAKILSGLGISRRDLEMLFQKRLEDRM